MENNTHTSKVTVKNVLRVLSVLLLIMVFCPAFIVSCSGQKLNVSVMTAISGVRSYGETLVYPSPLMLICLFIPIAFLVFLFNKKLLAKKIVPLLIVILGIINFLMWITFRGVTKLIAEKNYFEFQTTGWFFVNIIVLLVMIIINIMILKKKIHMETDLLAAFGGNGGQKALQQMSESMQKMAGSMSQMAKNISPENTGNSTGSTVAFCQKCGSPIKEGDLFCTSCGTPVAQAAQDTAPPDDTDNNASDKPIS